jgi:hypothetical protein
MLLRSSIDICPKELTRDVRGLFNSLLVHGSAFVDNCGSGSALVSAFPPYSADNPDDFRHSRLQLPDALLNSWLLVQSQVVVAGTYFVSFFTKILSTGGMWLWNANYIAIDLIKTQRQHYFSRFDPSDAGNRAEAMWLLEHPWIARVFSPAARFSKPPRFSPLPTGGSVF